jgi:hypothetical protein
MIFRIKHHWYLALAAAIAGALAAWGLGGWEKLTAGSWSLPWQVAFGIGGGLLALAINGVLHEVFKRTLGERYLKAFAPYARDILGPMRWPEYILGGVMAAIAEEPLFRGALLWAVPHPAAGIAVAALVFAACHWLRPRYLGFWFWALWEGVLFGILMVATGSLLVPMIAHGLHDLAAYRVFQTLVRGGESAAGDPRWDHRL